MAEQGPFNRTPARNFDRTQEGDMTELPMTERGRPPLPRGKGGFGVTQRRDAWWVEWLSVVLGLGILGGYATWAAFQGRNYAWGPYLSPFYSPEFLLIKGYFFPSAIIALTSVAGFRGTCYYYRKAYYRAFFADPAGCAVGEARKSYAGETRFPWLVQNLHRYFLYVALLALALLWYDVGHAFFAWPDRGFGIGLGSLLMLVNVCLLTGYTLGCHSLRHLVGGRSDCFSCARGQAKSWGIASIFNAKHMQWAWASLCSVCFTDLYIRLVATGMITDWKIL
jgi:hypothetical protein